MFQMLKRDSKISLACKSLQQNKPILLVDDTFAETQGAIVTVAQSINVQQLCLMVNQARGIVCAALSEATANDLGLSEMPRRNAGKDFEFSISVEAREGVTTGISAADRVRTLQALALTKNAKLDLVMPGHIFPVRAKAGGVLVRSGIAEAAVDLLTLAELNPIAAFCQCLDNEGKIVSGNALEKLANEIGLVQVSISEIIQNRLSSEKLVRKVAQANLPTRAGGLFQAFCFHSLIDDAEHLALVKGKIDTLGADGSQLPVPVRVQAENRIGDLFGSSDFLQRKNILAAIEAMKNYQRGVFVYIRHPHQGSLLEQVQALSKNEVKKGSLLRQFGIGAQILNELGVKRIRLISNSAKDISNIQAFNLEIVEQEALTYS
jgi:3,4-dihydroxy 2-butanone 4-phosphate synthase/GTP cyclohydrolase II